MGERTFKCYLQSFFLGYKTFTIQSAIATEYYISNIIWKRKVVFCVRLHCVCFRFQISSTALFPVSVPAISSNVTSNGHIRTILTLRKQIKYIFQTKKKNLLGAFFELLKMLSCLWGLSIFCNVFYQDYKRYIIIKTMKHYRIHLPRAHIFLGRAQFHTYIFQSQFRSIYSFSAPDSLGSFER